MIVLAAGLSRRAAPHHKLLLPAPDGSGRTVVRATAEALCAVADLADILVVTGHERTRIEAALAGLPLRFVFAADFAHGMGHSLAAGVRSSHADTRGFLVSPADLPGLTPQLVRRVVTNAAAAHYARHIIPTAQGRRGHPVFLAASLRARLETLTGDVGARILLATPEERARTDLIEVGDEAILCDVDV